MDGCDSLENVHKRGALRRRWSRIAAALGLAAAVILLPATLLAQRAIQEAPAERRLFASYRYLSVGWTDLAVGQLAEAASALPDDESRFEALVVLGMALEANQNEKGAESSYRRALLAAGDSPDKQGIAQALLGQLLLKGGRLAEAKEALLAANRLRSGQAVVLYGLAEVAEAEGAHDDAIALLNEADAISPEWVAPARRAARLYLAGGRYAEAAKLLAPKRSVASGDADFHFQFARSLQGLLAAVERGESLPADLAGALGVDAAAPAPGLTGLIRHAADRTLQLAPGHAGAQAILESLSRERP